MKNNILNFSREIIDLVCEDWHDDKQLVMDALRYLYNTSTDDKMKEQILDVFNEENYCIDCGSEMQLYEWEEVHDELYEQPVEHFICYTCPVCDRD